MEFSDKDILDLQDVLDDIGLAETPEEQIDRLRNEYNSLHLTGASPMWRDFLDSKGVSYTFGIVTETHREQAGWIRIAMCGVYPLIRGHYTSGINSRQLFVESDSFQGGYSTFKREFSSKEDANNYLQNLRTNYRLDGAAGLEKLNITV